MYYYMIAIQQLKISSRHSKQLSFTFITSYARKQDNYIGINLIFYCFIAPPVLLPPTGGGQETLSVCYRRQSAASTKRSLDTPAAHWRHPRNVHWKLPALTLKSVFTKSYVCVITLYSTHYFVVYLGKIHSGCSSEQN